MGTGSLTALPSQGEDVTPVIGLLAPDDPTGSAPGPWRGLASSGVASLVLHVLAFSLGLLFLGHTQRALVAAKEQVVKEQVVMVNLMPGAAPGPPGPAFAPSNPISPATPAMAPETAPRALPKPLLRPAALTTAAPRPKAMEAPAKEISPEPSTPPLVASQAAMAGEAPAGAGGDIGSAVGAGGGREPGSLGVGQGQGGTGGRGGGPDVPPKLLEQSRPPYPPEARRRGQEGSVRVRVLVDRQGGVGRVEILAANPPGVFEQAVRSSLAHWRFQPAQKDGLPVEALTDLTVRFVLDD